MYTILCAQQSAFLCQFQLYFGQASATSLPLSIRIWPHAASSIASDLSFLSARNAFHRHVSDPPLWRPNRTRMPIDHPLHSTHTPDIPHVLRHTTILYSTLYVGVHGFRFGCKPTTLIRAFDGANQLGNGDQVCGLLILLRSLFSA